MKIVNTHPTLKEVLTTEQYEKLYKYDSKIIFDTPIRIISYDDLRIIASVIFSDGKFVYPSDLSKLITQIEDNL